MVHGKDSIVGCAYKARDRDSRSMVEFLVGHGRDARTAVKITMILALAYSYQARLPRFVCIVPFYETLVDDPSATTKR